MSTRCKMYVTSVRNFEGSHYVGKNDQGVEQYERCPNVEVSLSAVYSPDPNHPNKYWWNATPSATMQISGPADDLSAYQPGTFWFIDCDFLRYLEDPKERAKEMEDPTVWRLQLMEQDQSEYALRVRLKRCRCQSDFQDLTIHNKGAWGDYVRLGDLYRLTFTQTTKD
jgi:hypothetical protein